MSKLNPKAIMEAEALNLIRTVTGIEEDEENFEICERFVLSNLFYHKFLDPDENKIDRSLKGLHQKLLIHAQPEKAESFQSLITKYKEGEVWNDHHEQYDLKYRLLSFLLNLASSPLHTDYCPPDLTPEEEVKRIDWLAVLKEGELSPQPLGDEEELSDWSDEEEGFSEENINPLLKGRDDKSESEESDSSICDLNISDSHSWLLDNVQFPYWEKEQVVRTTTAHPQHSPDFANSVEKLLEDGGKLGVKTSKLSEYQVLREILWMLRSPAESPLFQLRDGQFYVTELVTIPSLTEGAMKRILTDVLKAINDVYQLKSFLDGMELKLKNIPKTFEAYGSGLNIFFEAFSCALLKVESEVIKQKDTHTILSVLDSLKTWFKMIHQFRTLHIFATKGFDANENWLRSIKLLSVLYNALLRNIVPGLMPFLLDTFLRSIEPYFNIIQTWLTEGRLEDWCGEFIFYIDKEALDEEEDFWNKVFKSHDYKERLALENIAPLGLLDGLDQKIFVSGKSIEILSKLDHMLNGKASIKFDEENNNRLLFTDFLQNLESQVPKLSKDSEYTKPLASMDLGPDYQAIISSAEDPHLALAFEEVFKTIQTKNVLSTPSTPTYPSLLLSDSMVDLLLPLEPLLKRSLSPTITSHYNRACSTLVSLFRSDLQLEAVLSRARRVFFMEAGDLMHDFCTQLFQLLDSGDSLEIADSASLTLLLQDCLGGRYSSWCDHFSCSYTVPDQHSVLPSLDGLTIHLSVPWPLTIILSQNNLDTYNKVFVFLAGVKRSLWALQSVRLSKLAQLEEKMEGLDNMSSSFSQSLSDASLPLGLKQHRLQLLRSWLLYFTTTMHGYFMSRVVHSTELELQEQLKTATDLDMILAVHQTYLQRIYDRCFLHPSASMLREAVVMVLGIGLELQQAALSDLPIHTRTITGWEEKYSKCHKFLASTLQTMTAKRKLPHLEGLAIALLHSCPA
eukprot:GFUD01040623.1.p1 GENE.GFUD01040623.1~~GFUD01040623.1.p1  ORF type:complete len:962 (+),score=214.69 GFUD01040623.1:57-2942(+)